VQCVACLKRLERGTFRWPQSAGESKAKLRRASQALQLLLDGVDLKDGARRAWYEAASEASRLSQKFRSRLNICGARASEDAVT
jgi:hypothetical protein